MLSKLGYNDKKPNYLDDVKRYPLPTKYALTFNIVSNLLLNNNDIPI